jgi:hypothetical protein
VDWFKASAKYPDDPAIQKVGETGEVLFMRSLAYSANADTDGFIPETQLPRFGLPRIADRVARLVGAGLWDKADGGYQIRNWWVWQSELYAAERKRQKEANRKRTERAVSSGRSTDSPRIVGGLEEEKETTPLPPAQRGESCTGQHENCRGCGSTRRQQARAARNAKPPWCGGCDQRTRLVGVDSDSPARCLQCHPLTAKSA